MPGSKILIFQLAGLIEQERASGSSKQFGRVLALNGYRLKPVLRTMQFRLDKPLGQKAI